MAIEWKKVDGRHIAETAWYRLEVYRNEINFKPLLNADVTVYLFDKTVHHIFKDIYIRAFSEKVIQNKEIQYKQWAERQLKIFVQRWVAFFNKVNKEI